MIEIFANINNSAYNYNPTTNQLIAEYNNKICTISVEDGKFHIDIQPDAFGVTVDSVEDMNGTINNKFGILPPDMELKRLKM